jgi:hypothetical protein
VVIGTVLVGLMVATTGIEYWILGTGVPVFPIALVIVVGIVIAGIGVLMARRASP